MGYYRQMLHFCATVSQFNLLRQIPTHRSNSTKRPQMVKSRVLAFYHGIPPMDSLNKLPNQRIPIFLPKFRYSIKDIKIKNPKNPKQSVDFDLTPENGQERVRSGSHENSHTKCTCQIQLASPTRVSRKNFLEIQGGSRQCVKFVFLRILFSVVSR